jgi:hypothetical protein
MLDPFEWIILILFFGAGMIPLVLLFVDFRKRKQIHKPLIYVLVFIASWILLAKMLLDALHIWLALIAPFAVFGYVALMRWAMKQR